MDLFSVLPRLGFNLFMPLQVDNIDCWQNACLPGVAVGSRHMYEEQIAYNLFLAKTAHKNGLAIGMKVRWTLVSLPLCIREAQAVHNLI
jgi:hypothetical protein